MKRLILPMIIMGLLLAATSPLKADVRYSDLDTIRVVDSYGEPGDTVSVSFFIANNTLSVGAYTGRIVYDPQILKALRYDCFGRGCVLDATSSDTSRSGILLILSYANDPFHNFIPRGDGVVGRIKFYVRPSATPGTIATLDLIDDTVPPIEGINAMSDSSGLDLVHPVLVAGNFSVTGGGLNQPPVVGYVGPQQVAEGQTLQFTVTAHDPDGDPVTLTAQNLPANATFPTVQGDSTVSGVFTFTPSFDQGPDTFYVSFVARDDHNNNTPLVVQIVVLDQPNDILSVKSDQGGVPGAMGRNVDIDLRNSRAIYGMQFEYLYDPAQVEIVDIIRTDRSSDLGFWSSTPSPGRIIVLLFSPGLDPIQGGSGAIVSFITNVKVNANFGRTSVTLDSTIEVIDSSGTSRNLVAENGYFTVDRFGDANLDEFINVGDCVTIVAFVIERISFTIRQFDAADINRDGRVTIGDLQNVIDLILELPLEPGPAPSAPTVLARLSEEPSRVGDEITVPLLVDLGTEAAAAQFRLHFNPDRLEPLGANQGDMVSGQQFESNTGVDAINGVFYNLGGSTFGPATGEMANFRFRLKDGDFNPRDLSLDEFLIVDLAASEIPSEIVGQLPSSYVLGQNYPNPFNASTNIGFELPKDDNVVLSIYDVLGRKVVTLVNSYLAAGSHSVTWNGRSDDGSTVATGLFFYRLQTSDFDETRKMLLVK